MELTKEEINEWLLEEFNYNANDRHERIRMIQNLSPEASDIFMHLYNTGKLDACGHDDFDAEQLKISNLFDELSIIATYDWLIKNFENQ